VPFDRRVWLEATTLRKAGWQVSVICPIGKEWTARHEVIDEVAVYRHPLPPEISSVVGYLREYAHALFHQWRLARRIHRERGFDVVHICNPPDLMFLVALWCKLFYGSRVVFDQHDLCPEMYEAKYNRRGFFYHAQRWAERLTYACADIVISTNQSYREVAIQRGRKADSNVFVVRSAPNLETFKPVGPNSRFRQEGCSQIAYLGVMGEQEGIDHLLRSAKHVVHDLGRQDVRFVLIGDGPAVPDLKKLCTELGLDEFVTFTGRLPDSEMIERLCSADVCVDPGPKTPFYDKSTMNKIMEYMALSKPIVQFDLLEGRRSAGDASLYAQANDEIDFADRILELVDSPPQRREEMGKLGFHRMQSQLEWRHQGEKLVEAYQSLKDLG